MPRAVASCWLILGLQFAAVGSLAYEKAQAVGRRREIPTDWFLEDVHP
jgi:hypothetical protein